MSELASQYTMAANNNILWSYLAPRVIPERLEHLASIARKELDTAWVNLNANDRLAVATFVAEHKFDSIEAKSLIDFLPLFTWLAQHYPKLYQLAVRVHSLSPPDIAIVPLSKTNDAPPQHLKKEIGVPLTYQEVDYDAILRGLEK